MLEPFDAFAWNNKGVSLVALKRYDEALLCFEKAIKIYPGYWTAWMNRGGCLKALGRHEEAEESLEMARRMESS
jgi:tetratricopeptide (TPR) repeat protein